ncbi:hypothetical protein CONPUDRAFT_157673 [Coniophora puteana RWD-64-598 SS2]|uniref:DUF6534 domain-containing protein n=1 Tax=Coniophora puteana (strain RWD-64-598) TaxID=741705 RepID=A0A5M3MF57_CONPW|nr:uncharacterized protein CONPUDRAFT_157673 [Coniophora puteana RWD-64-598 SS2]EIW77424.1 hypothetical protein CONPUDRAFT_157673 [Coniophora puteana RWD-64-598 SS2]
MEQNVELVFGPMLIGVFMNCILYGVLYILVTETVNTGSDMGLVYEPLVLQWGMEKATVFVPLMLTASPIVTVMTSTPIKLFLAWRVKLASNSTVIPLIICILAVTSLIGGVATTISLCFIKQFSQLHRFEPAVLVWLVSSDVADVLITSSLSLNLYHKKTGTRTTDDLLDRIIRLTIQTGLVTTTVAIAELVVYSTTTTTLFCLFDFVLAKLYSNSLLSTLNAREHWRSLARPQEPISLGSRARKGQVNAGSHSPPSADTGDIQNIYDISLENGVMSAEPTEEAKSSHAESWYHETTPGQVSTGMPHTRVVVNTVVERHVDRLNEGF